MLTNVWIYSGSSQYGCSVPVRRNEIDSVGKGSIVACIANESRYLQKVKGSPRTKHFHLHDISTTEETSLRRSTERYYLQNGDAFRFWQTMPNGRSQESTFSLYCQQVTVIRVVTWGIAQWDALNHRSRYELNKNFSLLDLDLITSLTSDQQRGGLKASQRHNREKK